MKTVLPTTVEQNSEEKEEYKEYKEESLPWFSWYLNDQLADQSSLKWNGKNYLLHSKFLLAHYFYL